MKKVLSKIYILACMGLTVFFIVTIWNVTFGHIVGEYRSRKKIETMAAAKEAEKVSFQETILDSDKTVRHYLGYRVLEQKRLMGHFHHIDFDVGPDKRNYCVQCHGEMPHDKVKEIRAFGNMHAAIIACQTCHVRLEGPDKTGVFKWYDRTTGEITESPVQERIRAGTPYAAAVEFVRPGTYQAKIMPFEKVNGRLQRIDSPERIDFVAEYKKSETSLTDLQKSKALKIIHKIVSKEAYRCEDCHQKDNSLLPLRELGYPSHRIDSIVSTEVVGMIKNYTQFYMPRILHPGEGEQKP